MFKRTIFHFVAFLVGSLSLLIAQTNGTLTGTVKSATGAGIPNASVSVTNIDTNAPTSVLAGPDGSFTIANLPPGTYRLVVEVAGFKRLSQQSVVLTAGTSTPVNLTLEAGNAQETVDVRGDTPVVQDDNGQLGKTLNTATVLQLPILDRNQQQLVELLPGITPPYPGYTPVLNPQQSRIWQTNGIQDSANQRLYDGVENDEPVLGLAIHTPTMDSTQEMNVVTADYDASIGRTGGSTVNTVSRPGTNGFHGSLFEFNSNAWFNARSFFDPRGLSMPKYNFNEFGGSGGGPIVRDKTFLFASYEGDWLKEGVPTLTTVPTAGLRTGDFSAVPGLSIRNPITGLPFTNNLIPAGSINPVSQSLLNYFPQPNLSGIQNNYFANVPLTNEGQRFDARLDHHFSDRSAMFARYGYSNYLTGQPSILGAALGGGADGHLRADNAALDFSHNFSPSLVTDLRLNYDLYRSHINPMAGGIDSSSIGLSGANGQLATGSIPNIQIAGMNALGNAVNWPAYDVDSNFNLVNNWSKVLNRHQIRFGADVWWVRLDGWQTLPYSTLGAFSFEPGGTMVAGSTIGPYSDYANAFASFLLGAPTQASIANPGMRPSLYNAMASGYVADTIKLGSHLTLDLGLRYEFFQPLQPRNTTGITSYDPTTNTLRAVGPTGSVDQYGNVRWNTHNFAPRFGFAYHPLTRTVIRGGYGISYWPGMIPYEATAFNFMSGTQAGVAGSLQSVPFQVPSTLTGTGTTAANGIQSFVPSDIRTPYVQTFNVSIQQDLGQSTLFDIGYVGSLGRELPYTRDVNAAMPGTGAFGTPFFSTFGMTSPVLERTTGLTSNYNALQVSLTRRMVHGLAFTAAYTYSKAMDYGGGLMPLMNNVDIRANYGPADFDRTHVFSLSHVWQLPFGAGTEHLNHGVLGHILGPWQVNGILRYATGTPWTPTASAAICQCPGNTPSADLVPAGTSTAIGYYPTFFGFFPYAFTVQNYAFAQPAAGSFGNIGRNSFRTGDFWNYDLSLFRSFQFVESTHLEVRATAYNIANSTNFGSPITNVNSAYFGQSLTTAPGLGPRTLQFALRLVF